VELELEVVVMMEELIQAEMM
ncbi:hypothetical protein Tco_0384495, partial [Tanacetum coccineum]